MDLAPRLEGLLRPTLSSFSDNGLFRSEIELRVRKGYANRSRSIDPVGGHVLSIQPIDFAGVSKAPNIKLALELVEKANAAVQYNRIVLTHPDLIRLRPMKMSIYRANRIYVNRCGRRQGDIHWVFEPRYSSCLASIFDSPLREKCHELHEWIKRDLVKMQRVKYRMDNIVASLDIEILRQAAATGIHWRHVQKFGITEEEYGSHKATY